MKRTQTGRSCGGEADSRKEREVFAIGEAFAEPILICPCYLTEGHKYK